MKIEDPTPDKTYVIVVKADEKWKIVETRTSLSMTTEVDFSVRGSVAGEPVVIDGKGYTAFSIAVLETRDSDAPAGWNPSDTTPMN